MGRDAECVSQSLGYIYTSHEYGNAEFEKKANNADIEARLVLTATQFTDTLIKACGNQQQAFNSAIETQTQHFANALKTNAAQCAAAAGRINKTTVECFNAELAKKADNQYVFSIAHITRAGSTGKPSGAPSIPRTSSTSKGRSSAPSWRS